MKIRIELTLIKELEVNTDTYGLPSTDQLTIAEVQKQEKKSFDSDPYMYFDAMGTGRNDHKFDISEIADFNIPDFNISNRDEVE